MIALHIASVAAATTIDCTVDDVPVRGVRATFETAAEGPVEVTVQEHWEGLGHEPHEVSFELFHPNGFGDKAFAAYLRPSELDALIDALVVVRDRAITRGILQPESRR